MEEEARIVLDIIESKIGAVEVEPDDAWTLYGDHHAYSSYAIRKFEVEGALALVKDKDTLKKLIQRGFKGVEKIFLVEPTSSK